MPSLTPITVVSGISAIWAAMSSTVCSSSSRGTTRLTRPHSAASSAVRVRAVRRYSAAFFQFIITHGSIMVCAPGSPYPWGSGIWKYASSDAIVRSVR